MDPEELKRLQEEAAKKAAEALEAKHAEATKAKDEEIAKLRGEAEAAATAAKAALEAASKFEGLDLEEVKKALETKKAAEKKALEDKGEYDRIVKSITEEHTKALSGKDKELEGERAKIAEAQTAIKKLTVGAGFAGSKFIAETLVITPAKAERLYGDHFDFEEGVLVPFDKPRGATERTRLVDGAGKLLTFEAAIEKIVSAEPDFETMKRSKMKTGANSSTTGKTEQDNDSGEDEVTGLDRIRMSLEKTLKDKKS